MPIERRKTRRNDAHRPNAPVRVAEPATLPLPEGAARGRAALPNPLLPAPARCGSNKPTSAAPRNRRPADIAPQPRDRRSAMPASCVALVLMWLCLLLLFCMGRKAEDSRMEMERANNLRGARCPAVNTRSRARRLQSPTRAQPPRKAPARVGSAASVTEAKASRKGERRRKVPCSCGRCVLVMYGHASHPTWGWWARRKAATTSGCRGA